MNKSPTAERRKPLYRALIIILILAVLGVAAWTATSSTALSLDKVEVAPTHARSFAFAEIPKPTYTVYPPTESPTSVPPETATEAPTEAPTTSPTPESLIFAEIVADNSVPVVQNPYPAGQEPAVAPSYGGNKYILVDISDQYMYVYEGDVMIYSFVASTGMNNATRAGLFSVLDKIPNAYGATWNIWMPNWLGIYWAGSLENGIHALPILSNGATLWEGYLGTPISFGCVVLGTYESQLLYDWAEVGTPVEIQR